MLDGLHPATLRAITAGLAGAAYAALCAAIYWRERRKAAQAERDAAALRPAAEGAPPLLVAFASQTGFAEEIAWQSARALHTAGLGATVRALGTLTPADLAQAERALFIVSTYGEGDPPDPAAPFARRLGSAADLGRLHHGVLALGDRHYANFCGFGHQLAGWLAERGATPMFPTIEVDNDDAEALERWRQALGRLAGTADLPDWQAPPFSHWRLAGRQHLNPGSAGGPTFLLRLEPAPGEPLPDWCSGDLAQIVVPQDRAQRPREYSVASMPADGAIELIVRRERRADGSAGLASGWLTESLAIGGELPLRLRSHANFRLGANAERPLILIGNGTGLAGLRGHLKARAPHGRTHRHWLLFGERHAAHDFYCRDELMAWQASGVLERADLVFSRDGGAHRHVQDRLRAEGARVREWLAAGAAIYVCGSLAGMAGGVQAALTEIVGSDTLDRLIEEGRYRRDVY